MRVVVNRNLCESFGMCTGVAPEVFERVVGPLFLMEGMDDDVAKVRHDPVAERHAIDRSRLDAMVLLEPPLEFIDDGLEVRFAGSRADQEEIRVRRNAAQIDGYRPLGFFVRGDPGTQLEELC